MATTQGGNGTVIQKATVERTDWDFVDGICSGYLTYYHEFQDQLLSDSDVYAILAQNNFDVRGIDRFDAGYCTGRIEALLEDRQILRQYWRIL